jgi:hypothetical protein
MSFCLENDSGNNPHPGPIRFAQGDTKHHVQRSPEGYAAMTARRPFFVTPTNQWPIRGVRMGAGEARMNQEVICGRSEASVALE